LPSVWYRSYRDAPSAFPQFLAAFAKAVRIENVVIFEPPFGMQRSDPSQAFAQ
jgi:hypothetical protein